MNSGVTIGLDNQIATIIGLFSSIAGIAVSAVGLVIAVFILKRGNVKGTTPTGRQKKLFDLLTITFCQTLSPVLTCMCVIAFAMQGMMHKKELFIMESPLIAPILIYGIPFILSITSCIYFIRGWDRLENLTFTFELFLSGTVLVLSTVLFFLSFGGIPLYGPAGLCFVQIVFLLLQSWQLMRKE